MADCDFLWYQWDWRVSRQSRTAVWLMMLQDSAWGLKELLDVPRGMRSKQEDIGFGEYKSFNWHEAADLDFFPMKT